MTSLIFCLLSLRSEVIVYFGIDPIELSIRRLPMAMTGEWERIGALKEEDAHAILEPSAILHKTIGSIWSMIGNCLSEGGSRAKSDDFCV